MLWYMGLLLLRAPVDWRLSFINRVFARTPNLNNLYMETKTLLPVIAYVVLEALQFYSFNKYQFCGHIAVMGERVEPGRTRAGFWNFFLYSGYGPKVLSQLCKKGNRSRPQRRFERWGVDSKFLCYDRSDYCNRC